MNLGIIVASGDPWRFIQDIYEDFQKRYNVSVFEHRKVNPPFFHNRINRYLFYRDLDNFLAKQDVVFFEWASDLLAAATHLPKRTRIITRLHRYEMFQWATKINWANVDQVILVSHAMQQKFAERFPEYADRTTVIYESVSTDKFTPVDKPFGYDVGTLCYLTPRKRVYELAITFAELLHGLPAAERPVWTLHIGGASNKFGDYNDGLKSLVGKLGLERQVRFYGDVTEPWTWYKNIDIFVSNSYSEGLQVAPMEAMASGRYTLSHHWDGAEELVPPENLFLTNQQLISHLLAYHNMSEDQRRVQQERMRSRACEKFDLPIIQRQIRGAIEALEPVAG